MTAVWRVTFLRPERPQIVQPREERSEALGLLGMNDRALKGRPNFSGAKERGTIMSQSLAKIYVHAIFSTKHRIPCLASDIRPELYRYAAGILKNIDCPAIQIGGTADHDHILGLLSKNLNPEEMIEKIKTPTSKWIKTKGEKWADFHWQNGYGLFSVSQSSVQKVRAYILGQEDHHHQKTFQEEFRSFLKKYQIPYDERYVWD